MKHVLKYLSQILFYIFCLVVLGWTASLTVKFVSTVLPGSTVEPFLALGVFDGGALVWLFTFLHYAKGLGQRAVSVLLMVLDLVGVAVMTVASLFLTGQTYVIPMQNLGEIAIWVIAVWTFLNLAAAYAYHVLSPTAQHEITMGAAQYRVKAAALNQLEQNMDQMSAELASEMAESLVANALRELGVAPRPTGRRQLPMPSPEVQAPLNLASLPLASTPPFIHSNGNGKHAYAAETSTIHLSPKGQTPERPARDQP